MLAKSLPALATNSTQNKSLTRVFSNSFVTAFAANVQVLSEGNATNVS